MPQIVKLNESEFAYEPTVKAVQEAMTEGRWIPSAFNLTQERLREQFEIFNLYNNTNATN